MSMDIIKNIEKSTALELGSLVACADGQIASKTLAQNKSVTLTLFAFDAEEEISTHASDGDALVQVLLGVANITIDGKEYEVKEGESIVMPAGQPHAVFAKTKMKMLLTVVFPVSSL